MSEEPRPDLIFVDAQHVSILYIPRVGVHIGICAER